MSLFWTLACCSAILWFLTGHQASHGIALNNGKAELSPGLTRALWACHWLDFAPWIFIVLYGMHTTWWRGFLIVPAAMALRFALHALAGIFGLQREAWVFSLAGLVIVPAVIAVCAVAIVHG
jgi:hypothetical protein